MKEIYALLLATFALAFVACGDDSSSSPAAPADSSSSNAQGEQSSDSKNDEPCGFSKEGKVWKFTYSTWNISEIYTWVDETTVKHETYMNAYHMDEDDETLTDQNRDELFEIVKRECELMTSED